VDDSGEVAGVQPFAGCGVSWSAVQQYLIRPSLVSADGLYYLACPLVGMQLLSAANPNSGTLRVDQPFPGASTTTAAFALDGVTAFLGSATYAGSNATLWRADADAMSGTGADPAFVRTTDPSEGNWPTTLTMIEGVAWATLTATTSTSALVSYDVAAPNGPWPRLGGVNVGPTNGMVYTQPVTDDETLYLTALAAGAPELIAVDVRTPASPVKLWTVTGQTGQAWDGLALSRQRLYAARNTTKQPSDVSVFDVSGLSPVALTSVTVCDYAPVKKLHEIAVQGPYLFFTYDSSSGVAPYGVGVVKLGADGSGAGATLVGTWESGLPLGAPQVVGDLLYVRANQGLAVFDLTPLWRYGVMPESLGLRGPPEGSTTRTAVRLVVDGPWAFLLGDGYRIFDLR
jgi:hypothetical protein